MMSSSEYCKGYMAGRARGNKEAKKEAQKEIDLLQKRLDRALEAVNVRYTNVHGVEMFPMDDYDESKLI